MTPQGTEVFRGIDASITGPLNQVNPFGLPTVFTDNNASFPAVGADVRQDSQFLVASTDVVTLPVFTRESSSELRGVFSQINRLGLSSPIDFARIVTDQPDSVAIDFEVDFVVGTDPARFAGSLAACLANGCADPDNPDPVDPTDPTDPTNPTDPTDPTNPNPNNPIPNGPYNPGPPRAQVLIDTQVTPGMPDHWTHTISLLMAPGATLRGVDAIFFGPMNQVNPAGIDTIFTDANTFFPFVGADPLQDSQFLVASSTVLTIGADESDTLLKAAISGLVDNGLPNPAPIARLVTPILGDVEFQIAIDTGVSQATIFRGSLNSFLIPEPTSAALTVGLLLGCFERGVRRRK